MPLQSHLGFPIINVLVIVNSFISVTENGTFIRVFSYVSVKNFYTKIKMSTKTHNASVIIGEINRIMKAVMTFLHFWILLKSTQVDKLK